MTETGGRIQEFTNDTYFGIVGLRGDFADSFHYDVFAQYGLAKRHEALLNDLDYNKTAQAINATVGANGTPVCVNPANGCVPVNLFTSQPISAAALSFITANGAREVPGVGEGIHQQHGDEDRQPQRERQGPTALGRGA